MPRARVILGDDSEAGSNILDVAFCARIRLTTAPEIENTVFDIYMPREVRGDPRPRNETAWQRVIIKKSNIMRFRGLLTLLCGLILAVGCTYDSDIDTSGFGSEGEGVTTVNIRATLPEFGGVTRGVNSAKGGTTNIDWEEYSLRVIIKAYGDESEPVEYRGKEAAYEVRYLDDTSVGADGRVAISLDMPLTSDHTYDIYMWADYVKKGSEEDLHYDTAEFPAIKFNHSAPVINDESLDAFYGKAEITVGDGYYLWDEGSQFPISRAVAKLRMVATDADSASAASATLQTDKFYTGFNIATEALTASAAAVKSEKTVFEEYSDEMTPTTKSFITAYMLWPAEQSTNIVAEFYEEGNDEAISTIEPAGAIPLKRGNLTTLRGALLVTDSGWDGNVEQPEVLDGDTLVVSTPGQLLWLVENGAKVDGVEYRKIRLGADINVNNQAVIHQLKLYEDTDFDGNGKTLKGLGEPTTALFGSVQGLNAYNFTLEGYNVSAQDGHVGVLVNELHKSATFADITIKNSAATTATGAAGGVVGYVGGGSSVNLDVVFKNCDLVNVKADGTSAEGKFVGLMQGYDNGETLSFDADCSADDECGVANYASPYTESNDAQWLDGDYPKSFDFSAYNGWLGDEEMYRAVVSFADNRMQIKWDGVTKVEPLKDASGSILIYSPFDLASLQQTVVRTGTDYPYTYTWSGRTSWGTVIFESDVDLGGVCDKCREENCICTKAGKGICDCTECRKFTPIRSIKTLDGKNHTVYNLHIDLVHDGDGMAFMQTTVSGAVHKDITFVGANIKTDHDRNIPVCNYAQEDNGSGNGYGGTFVSATGGGTYTISNVHVKDGKVSGVCKIGGLIGKAGCATLNMTNCSVDNYVVENYEANRPNYYPIVMEGSMSVTCLEWWYTQGECGGLIGFVQCSSVANIEGCSVTNTHMNCYDQPNKTVTANVISGSYSGMSPTTKDSTLARGSTLIAGRHVNQFIGDVVSARTSDSNTTTYVVNIKDYYVDGNTYRGDVAASSTNNYNHAYEQKNTGSSWRPNYVNSAWCEVVGCAYYVGVEININLGLTKYQKHVRHYAGTLTFNKKNGSTITLTENASEANGIKWIGGNFSIEGIGGKTNYPPAPSASEIGE